MLLDKKYNDGDVVTLKLNSGEEVIGRYVGEDMISITLSKPLTIAMTPKGPGMAPVLITVDPDSSLTFSKSAITVNAKCHREIADQYIYQTTGIQPVGSSSIVRS
jgi:hypothetical protein